jgi:hypothetical protein
MKTLLFKLSDFDGEGDDLDDLEFSCDAPNVEPLPRLTQERCDRGNLFRVLAPITLFGAEPGVTLGQIIEAEPVFYRRRVALRADPFQASRAVVAPSPL